MTTPDFRHSARATQARVLKAIALEDQLRKLGIPLAAARTLPEQSRRRIARDAGVPHGSPETWDKVFEFMADHEQHHPPPLVTTSCRDCGATISVPLELFDGGSQVGHVDVGGSCGEPSWR